MPSRLFSMIFTIVLVSAFNLNAEKSEIPVLTVCDALRDIAKYDGLPVIVVGRSSGTSEGSWLDAECGFKALNGGREFPTMISTAYVASEFAAPPPLPRHFRWDERQLREKLQEVQRTTQLRVIRKIHYSDEWLAAFGRLETKLPRKLDVPGHDAFADGFGHLSAAPAQLIAPQNGWHRLK